MKALPTLMVNMNITYMTARKIGIPSTRLSTTRSTLSETVRITTPLRRTALWYQRVGEAVAAVGDQDVHVLVGLLLHGAPDPRDVAGIDA